MSEKILFPEAIADELRCFVYDRESGSYRSYDYDTDTYIYSVEFEGETYRVYDRDEYLTGYRWTKGAIVIIKRDRDGKLFIGYRDEGLTELQEDEACWCDSEDGKVVFHECVKVQKVVDDYKCVD